MIYTTKEEATQKIINSTVLYDGKPVLLFQANGDRNKVVLSGYYLPKTSTSNSNIITKPIEDPLWDFTSGASRLGYSTVKSRYEKMEAVFTSRVPTRVTR